MRTFTQWLEKAPVEIHLVETQQDCLDFIDWITAQGSRPVAVDTETTGLDVFASGFAVKTVQFGNGFEAFVIPADVEYAQDVVDDAFRRLAFGQVVMHNAAYDSLVLYHWLELEPALLLSYTTDTRILAHLLDPRAEHEGGMGHGLKRLASVWVDADAPDSEQALKARFRELGVKQADGYALLDPRDEVLVRYGGLDTILTWRVHAVLSEMVADAGLPRLSEFEHRLQAVLVEMQMRGLRLDVDYTRDLVKQLESDQLSREQDARRFGVSNVNSTSQVAEALLAMGEELLETTASGAPKVDKAVLLPLADLDRDWKRLGVRGPNRLAEAVLHAKRASKWRESYAQAFLDLADEHNYIHPWINGLQARTGRMSVSRPPLQQLPSNDSVIRRAIIADEGYSLLAVDYSQIEMRVLAGLARDETMISAIKSGVDLHDFTAQQLYGDEFTKQQRKVAKGVGFGKCYGGGASTLSRQTGADIEDVKRAISAYDRTYEGIARYSRELQRRAEFGRKEVITPSGRHLPLDKDRLYSATNYMVQSTARDVLAQAIVNMHDEGLGEFMLLPIHDEVLAQAPAGEAEDVLRQMRKVMEQYDFMGVPLLSDGEIYGRSWGHGYGWED